MDAAWIRIRRVLAGVLLFTKVSAQEICSALNVTGGAAPGIYLRSQDLRDGKPYFLATDEASPAMLKYLDISGHRRLLEGSEPGAGTRSFSEFDLLAWRAYDKVDARRRQDAEDVGVRRLFRCPYGFWINAYEVDATSSHSFAEGRGFNYTYPMYLVPDCADHPTDVASTWYELACESCDPAATAVTVQCSDLSTNATPAPSGVTPTPTAPRVTPTPTLPGTTTLGPSPIHPGTTPTPGPSRTTPSPDLDPSEIPVPSDDESISPTIGPSAPAAATPDGTTSTLAPSGSGIGVRGDMAESAASAPGIACVVGLIGAVLAGAMVAEAFPALLLELP